MELGHKDSQIRGGIRMDKQVEILVKAIEGSEMWADLNKRIEKIIEESGEVLSDEEYQIIRNMMIMATIKKDPKIVEAMAKVMYDYYNQQQEEECKMERNIEITEELMDQMFENERGFDPMYDIKEEE